MDIFDSLNHGLHLFGFPMLTDSGGYRLLGSGAWHDAYLVSPGDGRHYVIRLRKKVIYGRAEPFDEHAIVSDYENVRVYYHHANCCRPGICPDVYFYHVHPSASLTLESYMGPTVSLAALHEAQAHNLGREIGIFFRAMHARTVPIPGVGEIIWNGCEAAVEDSRDLATVRQEEIAVVEEQLDRLIRSDVPFRRDLVASRIHEALAVRDRVAEPPALVNRDIAPENLIGRAESIVCGHWARPRDYSTC